MTDNVLLVDDDPDDADLVRLAFREHGAGANLVVALDADEAHDYLERVGAFGRRVPGRPAVVLLDLKLRVGTGLEVLRRIRATPATATQPVVLMTSSDESRDIVAAYAAGANGFIQKPDTFAGLVDVTAAILRFWVHYNLVPGRRALKECR